MAWTKLHRRVSKRDYAKLDARTFSCLKSGPARLPSLRDHVGTVPYHSRLRNRLATLIARGDVVRIGTGYALP